MINALQHKDNIDLNIPDPDVHQQRIVILGAGFAGLRIARLLARYEHFQILIIDRNNYHQFQPLLYQVATAGLEPSNISFPIRKIFQRKGNVFFRVANIEGFDSEKRLVITDRGKFSYDKLIIALGLVTNYFGNKEIELEAIGLKSVSEALFVRNQMLKNYENALVLADERERESALNIAIVGGGPTGVELAGAMAELRNKILPNEYPELDFSKMNIFLIEASGRLLGSMSQFSSERAERYLRKLGVNIELNTRVITYNGSEIITSTGNLSCLNVVWAAGMKGAVLPGIPAQSQRVSGRVVVDEYHRVMALTDVYIIGDLACVNSSDYPEGHPQVAPAAIQQAENLAANLHREWRGKRPRKFRYRDKGTMATVGRNLAIVELPVIRFGGFPAWIIWMAVHLMSILGIKNRFFVFINWLTNYFSYNLSLRLILRPRKLS